MIGRLGRRWMTMGMLVLLLVVPAVRLVPEAAAQRGDDLPGMIEDGSYESPQFGTGVTWTDAWELGDIDDPNVAHATGGYVSEPVVSDPNSGDMLYLSDTDTGTAVLSISIAATSGTVEDLADRMQTDAFLEDNLFMAPGAEILSLETVGDSVGLLARDSGRGSDHALYIEVTVPRRTSQPVIAVAIDLFDPETYADSLSLAGSDLTVDGFDLFATHSVDDLLDLLGSADTTGPASPTPESGRKTTTTDAMTGDEYLQAVREDTDLRSKQLDRLSTILLDGGTVTAAEDRELTQILNDWVDMKPIEAPDGFAEIDDEHRALVKNLNALGSSLLDIATGSLTDEERDQQTALAGGAYQTSLALVTELDDLLAKEGV